MGGTLRLSAQAERDLEEIVRHIARNNPAAAERFGLALLSRAESLTRTPNLGIRVRGWPGVRALLHRSYYVVYRSAARAEVIEVIRFWHSARDLGAVRPTDFDV
jgi:toxin ParE1/3/4